MSIPGLVPPVRLAGTLLVDGGVLNNLPIDHMAETGEGPVVAVDVIRRLEPTGDEEPELPSITETLARATVLASVERAERNRTWRCSWRRRRCRGSGSASGRPSTRRWRQGGAR